MMVFCTLFDCGYLDKGLVMYESLRDNCKDEYRLYVLVFDDLSYHVLDKIKDEHLIPISFHDFETDDILQIKSSRNNREYMWTCSSLCIRYVLDIYNEDSCTYIDADMYFYSSPKPLFDELIEASADVGIMEHRFIDNAENRRYFKYSGKYCVEFNYFKNSLNGRKVLDWWCDNCIDSCQELQDGVHFGDQKYVERFEELFENVHIFKNKGAGVAPWNLARYRISNNEDKIILKEVIGNSHDDIELIFYHYQQITYLSENLVDIHAYMYPYRIDIELRDLIYLDYLKRLSEERARLYRDWNIDMWDGQKYTSKENFYEFMEMMIRFERNPFVAVMRFFRWILRRRFDYIIIPNVNT